ncbi:MAG: NAD-binding protein [Ignisphaera sp.]
MKIFLAISRKYAKQVIDVLLSLTPKPYVLIASSDDEVEALAKLQGYEFIKIKDIEKLYTIKRLEEFDIAVAGLDDDVLNIAVARVAKSMGIPMVVAFMHNSLNRDEMLKEGVTSIINIENFISSNLKFVLLPDTWIVVELIPMVKLVVAIYRVVKRSVLGVNIRIFDEVLEGEKIKIFAVDRVGNFIDDDKPLERDYLLLAIGTQDKVLKGIADIEKIFRRYEQLYTLKYTEIQRFGGYG